MILHPTVLALLLSSVLISLMALYAGGIGLKILRFWDLTSGSEQQLALERQTYLVSTIVGYLLGFQLISLFLFIYTADALAPLFVGAMCAVGTLTVNPFGYPVLLLKLGTFILAGLWLILNHADNLGYDYPLIRGKYGLLLLLAPLLAIETGLQTAYFIGLTPDIITSCCGSLFSASSRGIATEIANAPPLPMLAGFYALLGVTFAVGLWARRRGRGQLFFAALSLLLLPVAIVAVISVISLYIYQMPSHHCPFCILQREYWFIGYPIYGAILIATVSGLGAGVLSMFRAVPSLATVLPAIQNRLIVFALIALALLTLLTLIPVLFTSFTLR